MPGPTEPALVDRISGRFRFIHFLFRIGALGSPVTLEMLRNESCHVKYFRAKA
jgi:hypothetical protein